mmetsp:Transcript_26726/g.48156  ORF Transcript_26726/g.48156 Transcript_26726/m.48156 type:complete len:223 (+) Transcript_26726:569-1237(+)
MEKPDTKYWEHPVLHWNEARSHACYRVSPDRFEAYADKSAVGYFSGVIVDRPFETGKRYYFELAVKSTPISSSDLQVKVGLTSLSSLPGDYGFSDRDTGWSYYLWESGYCRHNSNSGGNQYGSGYRLNQTLGVYVDLMEGTLAFSVDGVYYGHCFSDLSLENTYHFAVGMNNNCQYLELLRKVPFCWQTRSPLLFLKKFMVPGRDLLSRLKPVHYRELVMFL